MSLDKQFQDTECLKSRSYGKLISLLKRQFDAWATLELARHNHRHFKMAHMPFIMNISAEGTSNNELAKRARVTKQAMSKVSKELQALGYIRTKADPRDKRIVIFFLTERGKQFVIDARLAVKDLMDEYAKEIGKTKFEAMLDTMVDVMNYNDQKISTGDD